MEKSKKHCKTRVEHGSAAGGAAPLSYGEERMPYGKDTARGAWGPLAGFKGLRLTAGRRPKKGRRKYVEPRSVCG